MASRRRHNRPTWLLCWLLCAQVQIARVHAQATLAIANANVLPTVAYEWAVSKSSTDSSLSIQQGSTGSTTYTVAYTQSSAPPVIMVQGQAVLSNPVGAGQLQVAEVEVQVQFAQASGDGPVTASVSCPQSQTVGGVLLVNAGAQLACNYSAQLPSGGGSAGPFVIAQANMYSGGAPIVSAPLSFSTDSAAAQPPAVIGQCALVTDSFDALTYQALGPPAIIQGRKPPRASEAPAKICASTNYTYTIQWSVATASACGSYVVASTAAANPIGGQQPTASTTAYLEINACNSAEVAVPPPVPAAADADASAPQVDVSITSISGGGPSSSWGVSATVDTPSVQVANGSTAQVTFSIAFTRSPASASAASGPRTINGAVTVTNPTAEPTVLTEVEVSWVSSDDTQQQQDAPASCPGSVGGSVALGANQILTCLFTVTYTSSQSGSVWASVVTSAAQAAQATQVTVPPVDPSSSTATGICGMASAGFSTGGVGQVVPASFTADSTVPPSSAAPVQLCDSASYSFTGVFGPFTTCGQQTATATAQLNPTGGPQATQSAGITADFTVLC